MYVHIINIFIDEVQPKKKKKIKHEPVGDIETTGHGEERIKKKKKIKSEPAVSEGITYGKKFTAFCFTFISKIVSVQFVICNV